MSDTDTMQAELEAAGYEFVWHRTYVYQSFTVFAPDGWEEELFYLDDAIARAYAHLQQQRELEALRAFVLDIVRYPLVMEETISSCVPAIPLQVYGEAKTLIDQYNIKDDDDERH